MNWHFNTMLTAFRGRERSVLFEMILNIEKEEQVPGNSLRRDS